MKESVLIEKTVQHACINFLLFLVLGVAEPLHNIYQLIDFLVYLVWLRRENPLEVVIRCIINLFRGLSLSKELRELFTELSHQLFNLILSLLLDQRIRDVDLTREVLDSD